MNEGFSGFFMDPLDETFNDWWKLFRCTQSSNVDMFESAFREAYRTGWLNCETWYSVDDPIKEELN